MIDAFRITDSQEKKKADRTERKMKYTMEFDLIPIDHIMRIYVKYCVVRSKCLSKPSIENRSQTHRHTEFNRAFIYPIIGFLIRSHCMNYTLYRPVDGKLSFASTEKYIIYFSHKRLLIFHSVI